MGRYLDLLCAGLSGLELQGQAVVPVRMAVGLAPDALPWLPGALRTPFHHLLCLLGSWWRLRRSGIGLVHIPDGSHAYLAYVVPRKARLVVTVHDLIPLNLLQGRLAGPRPARMSAVIVRASAAALARAQALLVDSTHTQHDLRRLSAGLARRSRVVLLPAPARGPAGEQPRRERVVLHVGNDGFYKNRGGVLRIFALLSDPALRLVLVGPRPESSLQAEITRLGLGARIDIKTGITEAELLRLYQTCALFLFPSLYEGFGWPPLEAMACAAPVVCSDRASLPEVLGDGALLCDPQDEQGFAAACEQVLGDAHFATELGARGQRRAAELTAQKTLAGVQAAYAAALACDNEPGRSS